MVTRKLLEIGPLDNNLPYEDQCLVFRAILMGGALRLPVPLVKHRRGGMTQNDDYKFGHRRAKLVQITYWEILELHQFSRDALVIHGQITLHEAIRQRLAYCNSILRLFKSRTPIKSLIIFWRSPEVPARDRYRYSRYYVLYPVLAIAHALRDGIRALRRKA